MTRRADEVSAGLADLTVMDPHDAGEEQAWRSTARGFLGYRYDRTIPQENNRIVEQMFPGDELNVDVQNLRTIKIQAIGLTKDAAQRNLHRTFSLHSSFPMDKIFNDIDPEPLTEIVCSFFHLKEAQAALWQVPTITTTSSPFDYVFSGRMYVGYQIDFVIHTEAHADAAIGNVDLPEIAKFSVSGNTLVQALSGRKITQITITARGLGGYAPLDALIQAKTLATLSDINQTLSQVEQHFSEGLPKLGNRDFIIEDYEAAGHVRRYIPQFVLPPMPTIKPSAQTLGILELTSLAKAISENISREEKGVFGDKISLSIMLQRIQEIFPNVITQLRKSLPIDPAVVVMGKTGAGKSTLIGHQLGYGLTWNEGGEGDRLDYEHVDASLDRPVIGHTGKSQTKGGSLYSRPGIRLLYLDSAGIFDTAGPEANLCNGIALSSIIRKIESQLTTLIIVLPSSAITQERASGFLELIDQLRKCLKNPLNPDIWANMVFVINDYPSPMTNKRGERLSPAQAHRKLMADINSAIAASVEECDQLLPRQGVLSWLKGSTYSSIEGELITRAVPLAQEDSDRGRRLNESLAKIRALTAILEKPDNLIVARLSEPGAQESISNAIRTRKSSSLGSHFTPENFYQDSPRLKFNTLLCAIASYYNQLSIKKADCMGGIDKIRQALEKSQDERGRKDKLLQTKVTPEGAKQQIDAAISENNTAWGKSEATLRETRGKLEVELGELAADGKRTNVAAEEEKIAKLNQDNEPIPLDDPVRPKIAITPRSWWTWSDSWATQYEFEYGDKLPYLSVVQEGEGKFTESPDNSKSEGIYKAKYLPKWHNYESDCSAQLKVYVATKDHPTTKASIRELEELLRGLGKREEEFKRQIEELELKCTHCETESKRLAGLVSTLESAAASQEELRKAIGILINREKALTGALETEEHKLNAIWEEIARYQSFFNLVADIVTEYRLKNELIATEREILWRFVEYVRTDLALIMSTTGTPPAQMPQPSTAAALSSSSSAPPPASSPLPVLFPKVAAAVLKETVQVVGDLARSEAETKAQLSHLRGELAAARATMFFRP